MHMECSGTGSPIVIMEAAASAPWSEWREVLSQQTRVCSYDRAGHGWSEPRKGPRDAETIVRELHWLLDQAGVGPPLVLVGTPLVAFMFVNTRESFQVKSSPSP